MSQQKELGVLFADISDSSHLLKVYGNEGARDILLECIRVMRAVIEAGPGRVVERIGDELLTVFPTPEATIQAAVDLQIAVARARGTALPGFLSIRIGFHYGPVIEEGDAIFGETIYTANRVSALAKGNRILTTGDTLARLPAEQQPQAVSIGEHTLKGTHQVHEIFRVSWDDPALTETPTDPDRSPAEARADAPADAAIELTHAGQSITLSASRPVCMIGRSQRCDIQLTSPDVSRVHTRIEYRKGLFFVVDLSANGTTVRAEGGGQFFLQEEQMHLVGSGVIQIGQAAAAIVRYACVPGDRRNLETPE